MGKSFATVGTCLIIVNQLLSGQRNDNTGTEAVTSVIICLQVLDS